MSLLGISKKGKWIIGGVCAFAIIATATTGLASWVISKDAEDKTAEGQITVASVTNNYIEISSLSVSGNIVFGPKAGDNSGLIQSNGEEADEESLSVTVSGTITAGADANWTGLSGTFGLKGGNDEKKVTAYTAAIGTEKNYLVAPTTQTFAKPSDFSGSASFSMTFAFKWGSAFNSSNPSEYYDTNGTYADALAALNYLQDLNNLNYLITVSVTTD